MARRHKEYAMFNTLCFTQSAFACRNMQNIGWIKIGFQTLEKRSRLFGSTQKQKARIGRAFW